MLPDNQLRLLHEAVSHQRAGRFAAAARIYNKILKKAPSNVDCVNALAGLYAQQGDLKSAIPLFRRATKLRSDIPDTHFNLAVALSMTGQHGEAAEHYKRVLALDPRHAGARNNYATTLLQTGQIREAVNQYNELIAVEPRSAGAYNNRGMALQALKCTEDALADYDKAIAIEPRFAEAHVNRGNALAELRRAEEALESYRKAVALRPDLADAYNNIGNICFQHNSYEEAITAYDKGLSLKPGDSEAFSMRLSAKMHLADWRKFGVESAEAISRIKSGTLIYPFISLAVSSSSADQLQCARLFAKHKFPVPEKPIWQGEIYSHDRIRVAYLSGDFREHPVANLLAGMFERHDRSRFEVTGVSFGGDQNSPLRRRIESAFERFVDVRFKTDQEAASLLRDLEIDIAVDLMGYTQNARTGIMAMRPAPVQVSYLGYLGTMGANFIDYVIADKVVLPYDQQTDYTEKIVHLPDCFLATDDTLEISAQTPSREEAGLPTDGFVFCCFNNTYKLGPEIFEVWMRLLRAVDGSVLWLAESNPQTAANLRRETERAGIDIERVIFAPHVPLSEHLARQKLADLFLDTIPYNAGATAAAALWSGIPVLTVLGETFVGRMAASMLYSIGLPELVTNSPADYEALALRIAQDPLLAASLKDRLMRNRGTHALFDTARFTRHIEDAYEEMWRALRRGRIVA